MVVVPSRIGNWLLEANLGSGFSGSIWRAQNPYTNEIAAIKIQHVDTDCPTNRIERNLYPSLQGGKGMPTLWAAGVQGVYDYLVIDLLGKSLDSLYRETGNQILDLRSVICIAIQVISRLEFMHSRGILHRDIQLGNCVIGLPPNDRIIYMIDFGFSKRYIDPNSHRHIPDSRAKRDFIGNYWFTSVNVHCRGRVPSRRDDLEALALMLIHLLTPNGLPWTRNGVPKNTVQGNRIIREKRDAKPEFLCCGLPDEFEEFLRYCKKLKFAQQPDYEYWRNNFESLAERHGWSNPDGTFEDDLYWPPRPIHMSAVGMGVFAVGSLASIQKVPQAAARTDVSKLLGDIANLKLNDHQIPGAKKPEKSKEIGPKSQLGDGDKAHPRSPAGAHSSVIVISSDDESGLDHISSSKIPQLAARRSKAATVVRLTKRVSTATDNATLAQIVHEFNDAVHTKSTPALTKEDFAFLGALHKQLADPSIFIMNSQISRRRLKKESGTIEMEPADATVHRRQPRDKMQILRRRLAESPTIMSNGQLGTMVAAFEAIVKKCSDRHVLKNGFAFLAGVEARLKGA